VPILDDIAPTLRKRGFARFDSSDEEAFGDFATELGGAAAAKLTPSELVPRRSSGGRSASLSEMYGLGAFEAHTDGAHLRIPPRWSVMRLAPAARTQTPTVLWDFWALALGPDRIDVLRRTMWVARGGAAPFYTSIVRDHEGGLIVRFNRACMDPVGRTTAQAGDELVTTLMLTAPVQHHWEPGAGLVFDNWRMLHARPALDKHGEQSRRLERILIGGEA
jgi:alpha-ketoglutarate-dependent taurine dioxygenase